MPVSDLHRQIAALALAAAREYGFALGGGNALLAPRGHLRAYPGRRLVHRPGAWRPGCRRRRGGRAARCGLRTRAAGPGGSPTSSLGYGRGAGRVGRLLRPGSRSRCNWRIPARGREPVIMDIAPVLDMEDVVAGKVCALASRIEPRDYADVVAAMQRHGSSQLIRLSRPAGSGPGRPGLRRCPAAAGPDERYEIRRRRAQPGRCHRTAGTIRRLAPGRRSHRPAPAGRERRRATARAPS